MPNPIDVDAMSDEELDSFLEEHTGMDAEEMANTEVVDEEEEDEGTTTEDVVTEEEEETTASAEEKTTDEEEESTDELQEEETEEEVTEEESKFTLPDYSDTELSTMSEVYEDLFKKGIKASGIERTVRDAEHLKTLVRIGFSANENNRKIKPYLKQLKSLEQAGVSLEDENLNFLVDVMNGNKDAIKELVTNRLKMDEDEVQSWYDSEESDGYVPNNHVISDSRFQLQEILEDIKTTPSYEKTIGFLNTIDDDGKVLVSESPELVKLLNDDVENGIFDKAMDEAQFRMDRGLLPKQSILRSYIQVMQDEDFYNSLVGKPQAAKEEPLVEQKAKKEVVSRKKRASNVGTSKAASTKGRSKNVQSKDINKMSDEEFDDFFNSLDIDDN